jgi:Gluconate 2-dehydrogenase subunit 3
MAAGESDPRSAPEDFFIELKRSTVTAYYTSKIGIHTDQEYKGKVYLPGDHAGFDAR